MDRQEQNQIMPQMHCTLLYDKGSITAQAFVWYIRCHENCGWLAMRGELAAAEEALRNHTCQGDR